VKALIDDDRATVSSLGERAKKNLAAAREIYNLAVEKKINIYERSQGLRRLTGS